jgi:hypothetical protein
VQVGAKKYDCSGLCRQKRWIDFIMGDELEVEIQNYSRRHVNAKISSPLESATWKFMGFYGNPKVGKRGESWDLLRHLKSMDSVQWVCLGDFNEILKQSEKWGGNERNRSLMESFQSTLNDCRLLDLGYRRQKFTWNNGRDGVDFIKERLDRVVANEEWCAIFPKVDICVEEEMSSDHCPIFVTLKEDWKRRRRLCFRHEARWVQEDEYTKIIKKVWVKKPECIDPWASIGGRLGGCKKELQKWQWRKKQDSTKEAIKKHIRELGVIQSVDGVPDLAAIKHLKQNVHQLLEQEEVRWKQRAKINWLQHGDKNTKFFHACTNQRRKANSIRAICDLGGNRREEPNEIGRAFVDYFTSFVHVRGYGAGGKFSGACGEESNSEDEYRIITAFHEDGSEFGDSSNGAHESTGTGWI